MTDKFDMNILMPVPELQSDNAAITGLVADLDWAKVGLQVKELQAKQEDQTLWSFKMSVTVDAKYHPKIIGWRRAVITQINLEHDIEHPVSGHGL